MIVAGAVFSFFFHALGVALGGYFYEDRGLKIELGGNSAASVILLLNAVLTLAIALPAMVVLRRTNSLRALRWLRNAALIFTLLNALVDFATEGFAALITLSMGLFALAILSYQVHVRERAHGAAVAEGAERIRDDADGTQDNAEGIEDKKPAVS